MKLLIIIGMKDAYFTLPPETKMKLMEGGTAFIEKYLKAGKIKEAYSAPGLKQSVVIAELESAEEIERIFLDHPGFPFMDVEMRVLLEWDVSMKIWKESMEKLVKK